MTEQTFRDEPNFASWRCRDDVSRALAAFCRHIEEAWTQKETGRLNLASPLHKRSE
jgi:hypothetical protein